MYIYNINFMVDRRLDDALSGWLLCEVVPQIHERLNPRVLRLVAVPGDADFTLQALSVSLQTEFESPSDASRWGKEEAPKLIEAFTRLCGEGAVSFSSVLKTMQ